MLKTSVLGVILLMGLTNAFAQTVYVNAVSGNDNNTGLASATPVATLEKAVAVTRQFTGNQPVTIKLAQGLYILASQVVIDSIPAGVDTSLFSIEAAVLPGDSSWQPSAMPVIQSISGNNKNYGNFNHCIGIQVERSNVSFKGLRFIGNPNPGVSYYYPVERHRPDLAGLYISQCLFVGNRYTAPIQGAVFAQGRAVHITNCTFYNCKNVVLCFINVHDFQLTHTVIYGAYEAAIRLGYRESGDLPFTFSNNIIAASEYCWLGYKQVHHNYIFSNSVITGNKHYMGYNTKQTEEDKDNIPTEHNVLHGGNIIFDEALRLLPVSAGYLLKAGYNW